MNLNEQQNQEPAELYLLHDGMLDIPSLSELAPEYRLIDMEWGQHSDLPEQSRVLLHLGEDKLRDLLPRAAEQQWEVGILPHPEAEYAKRALGLKGDVEQVFNHYLQTQPITADVLICNGQVVFSSVVIGEVLDLKPYDVNRPPTRSDTFWAAIRAIRNLRLRSFSITTGKDQKISLGALGMVILEQTQSTLLGRCFSEAFSVSDGRLTLLAFAPSSILSYIWFLIRLILPTQISLSQLPGPVGIIQSNRILIEASRGADYYLDGSLQSAKSIEFRILDNRLHLLPGPALNPEKEQIQEKDRVKISNLPLGETARQLIEKPLPLFSHASEEDYRDLFVSLRQNAALSSAFLVLMVLSTLLALTGLYANSAPVIIGAMILAPLMSPIVSLAMGLARTEPSLIRNSLRTLAIGIGAALFCAVFVAWLMPLQNITQEMQSRLSPTLLDLSVAIISGMAAAYAHAKEEVAKSLAGVAIAVALVPPLSVAGIGFGWGDWDIARGAGLLFFTNLVGIALAASATFLIMGFAPFKLAKKGLAIALLMMAIISAPLSIAFLDLVNQGRIVRQIPTGEIDLAGLQVNLRIVDVITSTPPLVRVVLSASERVEERHLDTLKQVISDRIGKSVVLEAQISLRR